MNFYDRDAGPPASPQPAGREDLSGIRIAVVFRNQPVHAIKAYDMSVIRWLRVSEALSYLGFSVDMVVNDTGGAMWKGAGPRLVSGHHVDWSGYHVVKTLFHSGFDALRGYGGDAHPFIISKLGSVVGSRDGAEGVHFFGSEREELYEMQARIARTARYVTILTEPSKALWIREHGDNGNTLLVPTGVDRVVPERAVNPYRDFDEKIAVFIGNFYGGRQAEVNRDWQSRLNTLGRLLAKRGVRLCVVGNGDSHLLDRRHVTYLGPVEHSLIWDYQYFAHVGLVLAQGEVQHNESSKIYYYLRTGLPVVSERPVPNNDLIEQTGLGYISDFNDPEMMAEMINEAANKGWDGTAAMELMIRDHTWERRVETYRQLLLQELLPA